MIWEELVLSSDTDAFAIKVILLTIIVSQFVCFRFDLAFLSGKSRRRVFGPLVFEQLREMLSAPEKIHEHAVDRPSTPRPTTVLVALLVKCVRLPEGVRLFMDG